jgi:hypothetical protein
LQAFNGSYDRFPARDDFRLVDIMTAAEALLAAGSLSELTFKLSFRVTGVLGPAGPERARILAQSTPLGSFAPGGTMRKKTALPAAPGPSVQPPTISTSATTIQPKRQLADAARLINDTITARSGGLFSRQAFPVAM